MKLKHKIAYLKCADAFAECSNGVRLKVGCVITKPDGGIIAEGYNGLPSHLDGPLEDENNVTKPEVRHAEKNALMKLTKSNESSVGAKVFCTHTCCFYCAVDLVDADIREFYYKDVYKNTEGIKHLLECGVKVYKYRESEGKFYQQFYIGGEVK